MGEQSGSGGVEQADIMLKEGASRVGGSCWCCVREHGWHMAVSAHGQGDKGWATPSVPGRRLGVSPGNAGACLGPVPCVWVVAVLAQRPAQNWKLIPVPPFHGC